MNSFRGELLADYHQILITDDYTFDGEVNWEDEELWSLLISSTQYLIIGTVRSMPVSVEVVIMTTPPVIEVTEWDHVNECSIEITSGILRIMGMTDYAPHSPVLHVEKGIYGATICYANLILTDEYGLEGDDSYHIFLWPTGEHLPKRVVKGRPRPEV